MAIKNVSSQMLLDRVNIRNKKLVQKEALISTLRDQKPEVLLTLGAGDIDQFVLPITQLFSALNEP
jgi:UDP-N-acetylmuramate--alanine ligase